MVHSLSIIDGTPSDNYAFWALNLSSCVGAFQLEYRMLLVLSSLIVFLSHFVIIIFDRCYVHFWKHFLPWTCQQKLKSILCNAWFFSWWLMFLIVFKLLLAVIYFSGNHNFSIHRLYFRRVVLLFMKDFHSMCHSRRSLDTFDADLCFQETFS